MATIEIHSWGTYWKRRIVLQEPFRVFSAKAAGATTRLDASALVEGDADRQKRWQTVYI